MTNKKNAGRQSSADFTEFLLQNSPARKDVLQKLLDDIETIVIMNQTRYDELQKKLQDEHETNRKRLEEEYVASSKQIKTLKKEAGNIRKYLRNLKKLVLS